MGGNFKIISTFSNIYSQCQVKIMQSSYKHLKCFPDIYNMSKQKQASFTITPTRRGEAQDLEGGYVILAHAQNFISTSVTLVQIVIYLLTAIGLSPSGSTHLHTNSTQNDTKQTIHRTTQQIWKSAGRAQSWRVIPWHLRYN